MTNDADHDPEFEAFLRRRSPMHRRLSQIDHAEPSAELDRVVLDRARDAIRVPSQEPVYRNSRWAMPVGLAATILIAFTVVLNIDHRRAGSDDLRATHANARLAPGAAPVTQLRERARSESAGADAADVSASEAQEYSALPAPEALARDSGPAERRQADEQKRVAKSEVAPAATAAAAPVGQPALTASASAESRADAESEDDSFSDAADNAAEIVAQRDRTVASGRSGIVTWGAAGESAAAAKAPPPPASAPAADVHASPEAWLQEINRLRAAGKNEEADRELASFRRAHPSHPGYSLAQPPSR
jgi:resuscitation-promoting factor RpfA